MIIKYDTLLFLSGGKDSCYLAYKLVEQGKKILAFTANLDLLNKNARKNIKIVVRDLDLDHIAWRAGSQDYIKNIEGFLDDESKRMQDICLQCSILTQQQGIMIARAFGIKDVYLGFNKYNSGGSTERLEVEQFVFHNPLTKKYDIKQITDFLKDKGIITDTTETNCIIIEKIIQLHKDRFGAHPFQTEIDNSYKDNLITVKDKERYEKFGDNNTVLEGDGVRLEPTDDVDYLLKLISEYRYEKVTGDTKEAIHKYGFKFWKGYYEGKLIGIGYLTYHPRIGFTLDGYKDPKFGVDTKPSYISGRLISDYFLKKIHPELWTTHDERNRAATLMCKRIGFKIVKKIEIDQKKLIVLRRRLWE